MRLARRLSLLLGLLLPAQEALANDLPLTVAVVDAEGAPIPTAAVRHPDERDRHHVNARNGAWTASVLYLPDGTEIAFAPGLVLTLDVSAPGYQTQKVTYAMRKRRNRVTVTLAPIDAKLDLDEMEEPVIHMGRDVPLE
ncbi:MAG: hypothetical protein JXX28_19975 [Deltaproteobacteria bacterium]|nr:hypothetical protein [Deltaproteobacteria bacterium]